MRRRFSMLAAATLAITGLAAACGDDDGDAEATARAPAAASASSGGGGGAAGGGDSAQYCATTLRLETAPEPEIDFETASPEEISAASKAYASDTLLPLAQELRALADPSVVADIDAGIAGLNELAATGDFETAFADPAFAAALDRLHAHDIATCGWNVVDVTGVEYAFQGVGPELPAGVTSFEFTNGGAAELHEMVVFRRNDGVTETVEELLALPEEEVGTKVTPVAGTGAGPGDSEYAVADLTPGTYAMLCFIPSGTTGEDVEGTGPPHFTQGMVHEFTVA